MKFAKYHALGNDYIVLNPSHKKSGLSEREIRLICHRNFGIGSDGILWGPLKSADCDFGIAIFNPDGSEAEKSGNGLRIFSRYLWDEKKVGNKPFTVETRGGKVTAQVFEHGKKVKVEMGRITFISEKIPVTGPAREVINEKLRIKDQEFIFCAASIGNPHCVILLNEISAEMARTYGPDIEHHEIFPNRINVQFLQILDRNNIRIEIWERGAGYTLASGSSSSAAAAIAHKLGFCDANIAVHMPGGQIDIAISPNFDIFMSGAVTKIAEGEMDMDMFENPLID